VLGTLAVARVEERFPAWSTGQAVRGGHSILRLLGSDPFQAQILARWNVRPLEQPRFGIDPRLRGVLIHRALELAYGQVSETAPVPTDDVVVAAVDSAFRSELRSTDPVYRALLRREATRALGLLRAFIQLDGQREAMHVDALESRMSLTLAGVSFDLRADRIDRAEQGLLIIDYKTGFRDTRAAVRKGTFDQVAQLAAYALASDYEVSGVAVATLHPRSVAFRGIYSTAETRLPGDGARKGDPSLEDCQAQWLDDASARAATLARGECWLNLQVPASDWLPLGPLSRIAEVRRYG
jgi:RecB family exonuclease